MSAERTLRQVLLVGAGGQRAIERAVARVPDAGLEREVATLYATRAGFASVEPVLGRADAPPSVEALQEPSCRAVLDGSRAAMRALLAALADGAVDD
jgi:hypothetical protein